MFNLTSINANKRTKNIKFQVFLSFLLKSLSIFLSFYVVRLTIGYLGNELYGIWIVLLSIISWLSLFDVGIGNGLRNKLTIALSNNEIESSRSYISTSYIILTCIGFLLLLVFLIVIFFVDWGNFFNSNLLNISDYRLMMVLFLSSIIFSFVLGLINSILSAYQQNSLTNIISISTNIFFIFFLVCFKAFFLYNIIKIVFIYCLSLIFSYLLFSFYFFKTHKEVIPSFSYFSRSKIQDILSLGSSFFTIQIAVLLIFTVDNYIILQLLGAEHVSIYNIVFKLFSLFTVAFGIIISPMWSAFTEANEKKDFIWMKGMIKKLNYLFVFFIFCIVIMVFEYQNILDIWLPSTNRITPPFSLIIAFSFFVSISIWNNIYSYFLNGVGIVKAQLITSIFGALINIPLSIYFIKYLGLGLAGVVYAMCISLIIFSVVGPIITFNFLRKNY
jgi:O-antigen/teichoic acid export membrane protein